MHFAGLMTNKKEFNFFFIECNSNKLLWISFFFKGGQFFNLSGDSIYSDKKYNRSKCMDNLLSTCLQLKCSFFTSILHLSNKNVFILLADLPMKVINVPLSLLK